ncbi:hypothetical protein AVW11_11610 [Streptomyces amritsarensis]|uniref:Integral membrane protein n=1 Tax=Streptomyces amritsarensis TaxID=681158 RepID=A0ABX3G6M5_9ACTN|nr:hypothetical protein [Streptomyces amritsarensis]OLZ68830.1 hypothetical protein AVW11_11610 [Streptomyces amritsarensis]
MSIVKHLPDAAIPDGGAPHWHVKDAQRWLDAGVAAVFAPIAVGWILAPLVVLAIVLVAWNDPGTPAHGTTWAGYAPAVLLVSLPAWYRFLPAATLVSTPVIAADAVRNLYALDPADGPGRVGGALMLVLCAWAFAGSALRIRSRRRRRELFRTAVGDARAAIPEHLPSGHRRRGRALAAAGAGLCLAGAALLVWGLVRDLGAAAGEPYDAIGQQVLAMVLLAPGVPLLGRGLTARRAARRLHEGPQPVIRVGVREQWLGNFWLVADADTTTAPPLIAFRDRFEDGYRHSAETLLGGAESRLRRDHHDIDRHAEPYEALLYGVPCEGSEVVLRYAVYRGDSTITDAVRAVPLLPFRRHRLRSWRPAGTSFTLRRRAQEEKRKQRAAQRSSGSGSSCGSSGGCGSSCSSSCSSSCGGGCGGGD